MPGPPSLLESDPSLKDRFIGFIRDGVPRAYACLGCGFSYDTLYGWVRRGLVPDAPEPYASFARELYETEVELLRQWLRQLSGRQRVTQSLLDENGRELVTVSAEADRHALTWLLERRFPKAFGKSPFEPADPIEDIDRELAEARSTEGQLEEGGDSGQLDQERWTMMEEWFYAAPPRLLELARKTGLAQAAVEEGKGEQT
jgi:hypothetical protein